MPIVILVGCIVLTVAVSVVANRPHWRTYTFPADPQTGIAVAIDYPDNFQVDPEARRNSQFQTEMDLVLTPLPSTGLTRWWQMHVMHHNFDDMVGIIVNVQSGSNYQTVADAEKLVRDIEAFPRAKWSVSHKRHTLGPAIEAYGTWDANSTGNGRTTTNPLAQAHGAMIWPGATTGDGKVSLLIYGIAPVPHYRQFGSAVDGVIQRVHLIRALPRR